MVRGIPRGLIDMLRGVSLFWNCSAAELREIATLGTQVNIPAGHTLTKQGEPGSEFFLVVEGRASCFIDGKKVATFGPGEYFGELALLSRVPRSATIVADTDMEVLVLSVREFATLLNDNPRVSKKMLERLAERIRVLETSQSHSH